MISVTVVRGGLNVSDEENDTVSIIATAAIEAFYEIDKQDFKKTI